MQAALRVAEDELVDSVEAEREEHDALVREAEEAQREVEEAEARLAAVDVEAVRNYLYTKWGCR